MSLKRNELKSRFNPTSTSCPTGADYTALINSTLNLRDDQFYGVWKEDRVYYNGAIVFYEKAFYQLLYKPNTPYCASLPPNKDDTNWHKVQENVVDDDWFFNEEKDQLTANESVQFVGIGTPHPKAMLEVSKENMGTIKLQPDRSSPKLSIVNKDPDCKQNSLTLRVTTEAAELLTNSPKGFKLLRIPTGAGDPEALILSANANNADQPRVGIGTEEAEAHLEVKLENVGTVKVDGGEENAEPSVTIQKEMGACIKLSANTEAAEVYSWSDKGLLFKGDINGVQSTFLSISPEGKVGIATEHPCADLHIASEDDRDGHIKIGFTNTLPVINLINHRVPEACYHNAFAIGTNMDEAILKTDCKSGFVFKANSKTPGSEKTVGELTEGRNLMQLYTNGRLSVGVKHVGPFLLDVNGFERSYGHYTIAEGDQIDPQKCTEIEDVTKSFCDLKPLRFQWCKNVFGAEDDKWNFGLKAEEVETLFPEAVLDNAVSYEALVPVLIQVLQEQIGRIAKLENQIRNLESGQKKQS